MTAPALFDIRTSAGRQHLALHHANEVTPKDDQLSENQVARGLEGLVQHLGERDWMIWQWGGFRVPTGAGSSLLLDAGQAAQLGTELSSLSSQEGFARFLGGFRNPRQFQDAAFEARVASWCLALPTVRRLRFNPEYFVRGHKKVPEFELFTPLGRVVCECKRLHSAEGDFSRRLSRVTAAFDEALKVVDVGADVRLEVEIIAPLSGDLRRAAETASASAAALPMGQPARIGSFLVMRSPIGEPAVLQNERHVSQGRVRVGDTPTGITEEFAYLLVSSPRMERALTRAIGALINTAHRQLPEHRNGVIFIDGPAAFGKLAAASRLLQPEYAHCVAIGIAARGEINFSRRSVDEEAIEWLFFGKKPRVVERLRLTLLWRSGGRYEQLRRLLT